MKKKIEEKFSNYLDDALRIGEDKVRRWVELRYNLKIKDKFGALWALIDKRAYLYNDTEVEVDFDGNIVSSKIPMYSIWGLAFFRSFPKQDIAYLETSIFTSGVQWSDFGGYKSSTASTYKRVRFFIFIELKSGIYRWEYKGQKAKFPLVIMNNKSFIELLPENMELIGYDMETESGLRGSLSNNELESNLGGCEVGQGNVEPSEQESRRTIEGIVESCSGGRQASQRNLSTSSLEGHT